MVILLTNIVTPEQIKLAAEDYFGEYIKVVVDIETGAMAIGGEWHADGERQLLNAGCKQQNLWGGGLRLANKQIDFNSLINTKPNFNRV